MALPAHSQTVLSSGAAVQAATHSASVAYGADRPGITAGGGGGGGGDGGGGAAAGAGASAVLVPPSSHAVAVNAVAAKAIRSAAEVRMGGPSLKMRTSTSLIWGDSAVRKGFQRPLKPVAITKVSGLSWR